MKHHLSLLIASLLALGGPVIVVCDAQAAPASLPLDQIFEEARAAFELHATAAHDYEAALATFSQEAEAGPVELAFLPIEPAPARIEEALCKAPRITTANGYQRHAWLAQYRQPERLVSCDPLGLIWRGPRNYDRLT